jgi:rod shape-determining protein MreC
MAGRHFHLSNGSLFTTWLIAGIVILLLPQSVSSKVWDVFRNVFNPILQIERPVHDGNPQRSLKPGEAVTRQQYTELWKDHNNLKATLRELHDDYNRLAAIRTQLPASYGGLVTAKVVGTLSSYRHVVVINKGLNDRIAPGQYVLSAKKNSVIGVVHEATERNAKIRLLTDSNQGIEIRIVNDSKNRDIPGHMFGNGKSAGKIQMIPRERRVEEGDVVFASALPGVLNVPVVIGWISEAVPDEEHPLLWNITVEPAEDMTQLDEVAVIILDEF